MILIETTLAIIPGVDFSRNWESGVSSYSNDADVEDRSEVRNGEPPPTDKIWDGDSEKVVDSFFQDGRVCSKFFKLLKRKIQKGDCSQSCRDSGSVIKEM